MADLEPVQTSDTSLAVYLHYNNHHLVGFKDDPHDFKRKIFIFVKSSDTDDLIKEFLEGKALAEPRHLLHCSKTLIKRLNEYKDGR